MNGEPETDQTRDGGGFELSGERAHSSLDFRPGERQAYSQTAEPPSTANRLQSPVGCF